MQDYATKFLGKIVNVNINRPIGTRHLKYDFLYLTNYGYVEGAEAPDGEDVDVYVLGVFEPIKNFTGRCIAVVHRTDVEDDKLVVVPDGVNYSDEQIMALTEFQEKFFKAVIIRQ